METISYVCRNINKFNSALKYQQFRNSSTSSTWSKIITQAESTVGYSTSFLNLRWLLTDEVANLASHVNKLIGTNHPILKTARKILTKSDMPSWGLIVLLVAKAHVVNFKIKEAETDVNAGILHTQRMVAEVVEILRTGIFFHKSLQLKQTLREVTPDVHQGNKMALLIGDYLITKSYNILAEINNSDVEEIISSALRELCEAEFIGERDEQNEPLPCTKYEADSEDYLDVSKLNRGPYELNKYLGKPESEWVLRNVLGGASLLGKGCLSTVLLAGYSEETQNNCFAFGVNLALMCQAKEDLSNISCVGSSIPLNRVSAPILFHLVKDKNLEVINYSENDLRAIVVKGEGIERTKQLLNELRRKALSYLSEFNESSAKKSLYNIITNIR